jgi:HlyD family secretion protein
MTAQGAPRVALAFQSDLDRITQASPPVMLRLTCLVLGLLLVSVIAAAAVTKVDIVVSGPGVLATDHPTVLLQAMDRAVVRSLLVRAGDHVRRGQVLATLDPTFAQADLTALETKHRALMAEAARLLAEAVGDATAAPGVAARDPARAGPPAAGVGPEAQLQARLFAQRQTEFGARLASFDQQMAHDRAAEATARGQLASLIQQAEVARTTLAVREALLRGAVGSRLQFLDAKAAALRADGDVQEIRDRLAELSHAPAAVAADRQAFIENWRREVLDTLAVTRDSLAQNESALAKAKRLQDLVTVTAPEDGVVLQVAARAPGSVLGGVDPLLTLLPAHAALVAELTVKSSDIGYLHEGEAVSVKVDAYPFQRHGMLQGRVRAISAASQSPDGGRAADALAAGAVHRVSVDLAGPGLTGLPEGAAPIPGMTVTGDVRVGTRSVLAYFLSPITRGFTESLREP